MSALQSPFQVVDTADVPPLAAIYGSRDGNELAIVAGSLPNSEILAFYLRGQGVKTQWIHDGHSEAQREEMFNDFGAEGFRVLVLAEFEGMRRYLEPFKRILLIGVHAVLQYAAANLEGGFLRNSIKVLVKT